MSNYDQQLYSKASMSNSQKQLLQNGSPDTIFDSIFKEKKNKAKELAIANERRIEIIKEKLREHGTGYTADEQRAKDFITKNEQHRIEQLKNDAAVEEQKKKERHQKELETKAYLDRQIAMKQEKKAMEKRSTEDHAKVVRADVQDFERSKHEKKQQHKQVLIAHREQLMKQIGDHRSAQVTSAMASHELAINKDILESIEGNSPKEKIIKRPF